MIGSWTQEWAQSQNLICTYKEEIPSTNTFAKEFNQSGNSLVVTDYQPQGRGRGKNTWSPPKKGSALLSSWVYLKEFSPQPILAPLIGLAVYKALKTTFSISTLSLKAPNDIYIKDKKLGGILIEIETQGVLNKIIVGLGLNILEKPTLATATHLKPHTKIEIKKQILAKFLTQLKINLEQAIADSQKSEIPLNTRKEILEALNLNPILKEKYTEVMANGSLQTKKGLLSWSEL